MMKQSSGHLPSNLEYLLEDNRLKRGTATPESIAALWQKAVESARDSELPGISIDGALRAAYDAGHAAALAHVASRTQARFSTIQPSPGRPGSLG